jgi:hypothetical protein
MKKVKASSAQKYSTVRAWTGDLRTTTGMISDHTVRDHRLHEIIQHALGCTTTSSQVARQVARQIFKGKGQSKSNQELVLTTSRRSVSQNQS